MRVVIVYEYDGSAFNGSQSQKNGVTVQDTLESALGKLFRAAIRIYPSGRTDAGVSAENQVAHFDAEFTMPPEKIHLALNTLLPPSVRVKKSFLAPEGFHAQFSAVKKTYVYRMYLAEVDRPLKPNATRIDVHANVAKMSREALKVVGEHDFSAFMSTGSKVKDAIRTVFDCHIEQQGDELALLITANGFLYNMVRIIAGTLIEIGCGKHRDMANIIAGRDRKWAGATAPAKGLTLLNVFYREIETANSPHEVAGCPADGRKKP